MTLKFDYISNLDHLIVKDRSPLAGQPIFNGIIGYGWKWREWKGVDGR